MLILRISDSTLTPGNFGAHGEVGIDIFENLKDYITNVHVKDIREPGDTSTYCIAGDGKCGYPEIFKRLCQMNYSGCITVEPQLASFSKIPRLRPRELH